MQIDPTLRSIADRLKRQTTNRDILTVCEAVLAMDTRECPECQRRREQRTQAQQRWRKKRR